MILLNFFIQSDGRPYRRVERPRYRVPDEEEDHYLMAEESSPIERPIDTLPIAESSRFRLPRVPIGLPPPGGRPGNRNFKKRQTQ